MSKTTTKTKAMTFSAFRVQYAKAKDISDPTKAGKRLRSKIRNAYGKNEAVTKWIDSSKKDNKDRAPYPDVPPTVAKELLSL